MLSCIGVDFSGLPKPKEYPPLVFELYHHRRRCYYIQVNLEDDKKKKAIIICCRPQTKKNLMTGLQNLKKACWKAYGLTIDEWCHQQVSKISMKYKYVIFKITAKAFPVAVRKTRWAMGRWGWYCGYGSEEQVQWLGV